MKQIRETSYLTIIRPTLEYRAQQWFVIPPPLIQTLENVQRRAARFVINDYTSRTPGCVTSMLTLLEWQTLEQRRRISRLRSSINSWTSTETCTSDLVTTEPEINIGSSRRGPIMTLSETSSKEQHENGTTYQTPQLESAP